MTSAKVLFLSQSKRAAACDLNNIWRPDTIGEWMLELEKAGVLFLDDNEVYLKYGHRGSLNFIKDFILENGIETLIYMESAPASFHFPPEFFRGLSPRVFTVIISGDTGYYFDPRDKYYAGAMDLFIVCDSFDTVQAFRGLGGDAFLFLGAWDRRKYFKLPGREKTIDVSFVGGLDGRCDRAQCLDYLAGHGITVRAFGSGTPGGKVSHAQMIEIFNKSKINLNFEGASAFTCLARNIPVSSGIKYLNGRLIEVALCGSFVLSERAPGIEKMLRPGEEMAVFGAKEELLEKIRFYLSNETEREAVAERGYLRAVKDYDVRTAIPKLLSEIETRRKNKRPQWPGIPADAVFKKNFAAYRMLWIIRFLKRLKFAFAIEEFLVILKTGTIDLSQLYPFLIKEVVDKFPKTKAFLKKLIFHRNGRNDYG